MTTPQANGLPRRARPASVLIVAAALLSGWHAARAEEQAVKVRTLFVSASPSGTPPPQPTAAGAIEPTRFDAGTRVVYARFAYEQASDQEIRVVVKGRGGVTAFSHTARYQGDGTATIGITGAAAYGVLSGGLSADARDAKQSAKLAAERTVGVQEFLRAAEAAVMRLQWTADLVGNIALPPALATKVVTISARLDDANSILARAIELPPDDVAGKQRRAAQVDAMLGEVVQSATELSDQAPLQTDVTLPETGHRPADAFVVQVEIDGDIAATVEFWVWGPARIQLPWVGKGAVARPR